MSDAGESARMAASAIQRASVGTARFTGRSFRAYRALRFEQRLAAIAALLLLLALFLPWYSGTAIRAAGKSNLRSGSVSLNGWEALSFIEVVVMLVVVLGVLALLFQRAERGASHIPVGADGWIVALAGGVAWLLTILRVLEKPSTTSRQLVTNYGNAWGIYIALILALLLTYAGTRIRTAHAPEPAAADAEGDEEKAKRGDQDSGRGSGFYIPHASPTSETVAYEDDDLPGTERPEPREEPPPTARRPQPRAEPPVPQPPRTARPAGAPGTSGPARNAGTGGRPPSERRTGWLTARPLDPDEFPEDERVDERERPSPPGAKREQSSLWSERDEYEEYESDGDQHPTRQWNVSDFEYDRRVRSQRGLVPPDDPATYEDGPADDVDYYEDPPQQPRPVRPRPQAPRQPEPYDIDASEDETIIGPFDKGGDGSEDETVIDRRDGPRPYDADDPDDTLVDPTPRAERLDRGGSEDKTVVNPRWRRKRQS